MTVNKNLLEVISKNSPISSIVDNLGYEWLSRNNFLDPKSSAYCYFDEYSLLSYLSHNRELNLPVKSKIIEELNPRVTSSYYILILDGVLCAKLIPRSIIITHKNYRAQDIRDGFGALRALFTQETITILIEENLDKPLHLIFRSSHSRSHASTKIDIELMDGVSCTIIESYDEMNNDNAFINYDMSINLQKGSKLNYYKLLLASINSINVTDTTINQKSNSIIKYHGYLLGASFVINKVNINSIEKQTESYMYGINVNTDNYYKEMSSIINHYSNHSISDQKFNVITSDNAVSVFDGLIFIAENTLQTNADMKNKNIILSDSAVVRTKPRLEVFSEDVKCSHGATVDKFDEELIYYMQTRGIDDVNISATLFLSFLDEIIYFIDDEVVKKTILNYLKIKVE